MRATARSRHNFTAAMDEAKANAVANRNRGFATGKSAKGWGPRRKVTPAKGTWDRLLTETRAKWHNAAGRALEDYMHAVNPSRADVDEFFANGGWL